MKYFKDFNNVLLSTLVGMLLAFFSVLGAMLSYNISYIGILSNFNIIPDFLNVISYTSGMLGSLMVLYSITLFIIEVINRVKYDSIYNFIRSIHMTFKIRSFLFLETTSSEEQNKKIKSYNKSVKHLVIDVKDEEIHMRLKLPNYVEAIEELIKVEDNLYIEITSLFPDYSFSNFERNDKYLMLNGSHKGGENSLT